MEAEDGVGQVRDEADISADRDGQETGFNKMPLERKFRAHRLARVAKLWPQRVPSSKRKSSNLSFYRSSCLNPFCEVTS